MALEQKNAVSSDTGFILNTKQHKLFSFLHQDYEQSITFNWLTNCNYRISSVNKENSRGPNMRGTVRVIIIVFIQLLFWSASPAQYEEEDITGKTAISIVDNLRIRESPDTGSKITGHINTGQIVKVEQRNKGKKYRGLLVQGNSRQPAGMGLRRFNYHRIPDRRRRQYHPVVQDQ